MLLMILAIMFVLLFSLKQVLVTQRHIQNIDRNMERLIEKTLKEEDEILSKISHKRSSKSKRK